MLCLGLLALLGGPPSSVQSIVEVVREIRVHGNHTTPTEDIVVMSGLQIGAPADTTSLERVEGTLRSTGRFAGVEVRKRYGSLSDPSSIVIIIVVDELASVSEDTPMPGPVRKILGAGMWVPILRHEEGYGFTYGARFSFVGPLGRASRVSVPLTWGGTREAALAAEWGLSSSFLSRVAVVFDATRRVNPAFDLADARRTLRVRAERSLTGWLRVGGAAETAHVSFGSAGGRQWTTGVDMVVDTRVDPSFPRDAVHATAAWGQLHVGGRTVTRTSTQLGGYLGVVGSTVLAVRTSTAQSSEALPPWEQSLLGGGATLRGYRAGSRAGDNLAAVSAELRLPLTSPLAIGRFGVRTFVDTGTAWAHGERLAATRWDHGAGAGVFLSAAVLSASLDVAWPRSGAPRWHAGFGVKLP